MTLDLVHGTPCPSVMALRQLFDRHTATQRCMMEGARDECNGNGDELLVG